MFEILKKKAKKTLGKDPIAIDGYRLSFTDQSKILKQHLTLYGMGFGVPHHFEKLGEDILKLWINTVKETNDPWIDKDYDAFRWEILECFRQEPNDKIIKRNLKLDLTKFLPAYHPFNFIDLFAGIGGFHLAMHSIGGTCVFASEWDKNARISYEANYAPIDPQLFEKDEDGNYLYFNGDINDADPHQIPHFDVLCGGFPCQAFSIAGQRRGFEDARGTLFFNIAQIVQTKIEEGDKPKVLLLENVKGLANHDHGNTLAVIMNVLQNELHYNVSTKILNAKYFGVPQNRERLFFVCWDPEQINVDEFHFPLGLDDNNNSIFTKEELADRCIRTSVCDIFQPADTIPANFTISDRLWEGHQRRKERNRQAGKGFGYSLFRAESVYTSTISARYYKDGSEILIDQSHLGLNPRRLTPVEAGRLQGYRVLENGWEYPENAENFNNNAANPEYRIVVSSKEAYHQFGNSVAVPVVKAIAREIYSQLLRNII